MTSRQAAAGGVLGVIALAAIGLAWFATRPSAQPMPEPLVSREASPTVRPAPPPREVEATRPTPAAAPPSAVAATDATDETERSPDEQQAVRCAAVRDSITRTHRLIGDARQAELPARAASMGLVAELALLLHREDQAMKAGELTCADVTTVDLSSAQAFLLEGADEAEALMGDHALVMVTEAIDALSEE